MSIAAIGLLLVGCGNRSAETQNPRQATVAAPKLTLVGLTSFAGKKRALLNLEAPGSSPAAEQPQQLTLGEHEKSGPLEVLEIDEKSASVRVSNSGLVTRLTLQDRLPSGE